MKLGICQIKTTLKKIENINKAREMIIKTINQNVNIILLPECFNSPYGIKYFKEYSESFQENQDNITFMFFKEISELYPDIYFLFGSIPEKDGNNIYNTMAIFYNGILINKYRKIHLYDINITNKHSFKESEVITPGKQPTIIKTPWGNIGVGICYDLRFPKLAEYYRKNNCFLIVYPGSFNMITGKDHWELLQRSRALDNMLFIASCSTARNDGSIYESWGHSMVVNPWGTVIEKLDDKEGIITVDIDINKINDTKQTIPIFNNETFF